MNLKTVKYYSKLTNVNINGDVEYSEMELVDLVYISSSMKYLYSIEGTYKNVNLLLITPEYAEKTNFNTGDKLEYKGEEYIVETVTENEFFNNYEITAVREFLG